MNHKKPESLYIDPDGYLFHAGLEKTGGVGLVKSPGLAEEIYKNMLFDDDGHIVQYGQIKIENTRTIESLHELETYGYLGKG